MSLDALSKLGMLNAVAGALDASDNVIAILEWRAGGLDILEVNDAFLRMGDYQSDQLIGGRFEDIVCPESEGELALLRGAAAAGKSYRGELLVLAHRGRRYWFGLHLMPADRRAERDNLCVILGRDITRRRAEAEQTAAVQSLLARVFVSVDVPIAILDGEDRIVMVNPAHERLLGGRADDWVGKPMPEIADPASRPLLQEVRERAADQVFRCEVELLALDGQHVPARLAAVPVERSDRQRFRILTAIPEPQRNSVAPHIELHGKIKLVSLAGVRAHLGERYPRMSRRVMATTTHILEHRIGPHDHFLPTAEGDFCIWFAYLDDEEADLSAREIERDIRARLIGEEAAEQREEPPPKPAAHEETAPPPPPLTLTRLRAASGGETVGHFAQLRDWMGKLVGGDQKYLDGSHLERDLTCLRSALARLPNDGRILAPVEFDHFLQRSRSEIFFTSMREMLTGSEAARNLTVMLAHLPRGVVVGRLFEVVHRLLPYGSGVGFLMDDLEPPTLDIPNAWFGIDARRFEGLSTFPQSTLFRLCLQIHGNRGKIWVRNVASATAARQLASAGVDYVSLDGEKA